MKYAVIDIGSNSVRLMLSADGVTALYKRVATTRLGEGLAASGALKPEAMERTAEAVAAFCGEARQAGAEPRPFATEAVRAATNGSAFTELVKRRAGAEVHVLTGAEEASIGYLGATAGKAGVNGIVDIGGASTELCVGCGGDVVFFHSAPVGVVRVFDTAKEDRPAVRRYVDGLIAPLSAAPPADSYFGIGGTIVNLASAMYGIVPYDGAKVHGKVLPLTDLRSFADKLFSITIPERVALGVDPKRADLICGGAELLVAIMERCGISEIAASESDNLEGYLLRFMQTSRG